VSPPKPRLTVVDPNQPVPAVARWDARLRAPGCLDDDRHAFDEWRADGDGNARQFAELQATLKVLQSASAADPQLRAMLDRARASRRARRRSIAIAASFAAFVAVAASGVGSFIVERPAPQSVYRTTAGERSTVRLADGSVIVLSSKTEMRVDYSRKRRNIALVRGEALFRVAKDHARPFVVAAAQREVVAVGTAFDVKIDPQQFRVTMLEGKVRVRSLPDEPASNDQFLVAGQRMTAQQGGNEMRVDRADLANDTAWIEDRLVFDGQPLAQAVAEMNRYTVQPITIADAKLKTLPISGMFKTNQPGEFVEALTSYYPIVARQGASGEVALVAR
jgi:transmembrane sensor